MNITFSLELNTSNKSGGDGRVLIRCTQNRKHKRISTGVGISPAAWNRQKQQVKRSHPLGAEYNSLLQEKLKRLITIYRSLMEVNHSVTLLDLVNAYTNNDSVDFFAFAGKTKIAQIQASNKQGTLRRYEAVLNKLKTFAGDALDMRKVNYQFLQKYELYMLDTLKNGKDTVSSNLSVIRAIINEAIRHGVYKERNPFDQIRLKYTDNTKEKLTVEELNSIFNTKLPSIPSLLLARDFFVACFLAEGTRGGDMLLMQKENIINGCLEFNQQKTGKHMVIPIVPQLMDIYSRYMAGGRFIFPLLNDEKVINEIVVNSRLTYINKYLRELGKYCCIYKKLSSHVARHTYTDLALNVTNGNIYQVQQSLGHSSVKTTEIYSKNRVNYEKASIMPAILQHIKKE